MLYLQTCIIGFVILLIPLVNRQFGYGRDWRLFRSVIITVMLDLFFETGAWLLNGLVFSGGAAVVYIVNLLTILLQSAMGLLWLYYALEKLDLWPEKAWPLLLCALPLALNVILLITNYWTHHVFYITPENQYVRGDEFWIHVIVTFLYPAAASALSLAVSARTIHPAKRRECRVLAFFLVPPVVAAVLQILFYGTFLFLIGLAISLLIVFVNLQNERITIDFLTQVNNRASFITYFERKMRGARPAGGLYLFMIDIDAFKAINDTYGHNVGDQVLITVAERLKHVCGERKCFLARLGGDEFSILLECGEEGEARAFADSVHRCLDAFNSDSNLAAPVTLSVGYTACEFATCSVDRAIRAADDMMYGEKARHHLADACRTRQK